MNGGKSDRNNRQAVALRYDPERTAAPEVTARGNGDIAGRIVALARDNGIHVYEDTTLAGLLSRLPEGQQIPEELYAVVAEVLAFVYRLEKGNPGPATESRDP